MKKLLLLTTTLVSAGAMASADVRLSGSGRVGLMYDSSRDTPGGDTMKVERRMTINIDGSGETDVGLTFGGRIRLRSDEGDAAGAVSSSNIWVGFGNGMILVGNLDGAAVNRMSYFEGAVGLTAFNDNDASFNIGTASGYLNSYSSRGNAGDIVRLDYSVGDFAISASMDSTGDFVSGASETGLAASYAFGEWNFAAQYTANAQVQNDVWSVHAWGSIGDVDVGVQYSDLETVGNKVVFHAGYNFDKTRVMGWVGHSNEDTAGSAGLIEDIEGGIGFHHSLGGATLAGGIVSDYRGETLADFGIRFTF